MNKIRLICMTIAAVLCFSSCDDDEVFNTGTDIPEGLPAILNLTVTVPAEQEVNNSRAIADAESEITQLMIIGYETTSLRKMTIDLTPYLTQVGTAGADGLRTYKLSQAVQAYSGVYRLYIIANWKSTFGNITTEDLMAENLTEDKLRKMPFYNNKENKNIQLSGRYGFPMSGYIENFEIQPSPATNEPRLSLKRGIARIEFNFVNGVLPGGDGRLQPNFTPTKYSVYNLPEYAAMFGDWRFDLGEKKANTFDIADQRIIDGKSFTFFMLEDDQTGEREAQGLTMATTWAQRESWDHTTGSGADMANRQFLSAPANSTYVVVEGDYSGPASTDTETQNETYNGVVRFIIHLGDFSSATKGFDDYNVMRNQYHRYTVTVNGASSITANVNVTDGSTKNPAFEGNIYASHRVNLDAHYEKVMLRIPAKQFNLTDDDGNKMPNQIILSTPLTGGRKVINLDEIAASPNSRADGTDDYKWIQFQKPADKNTFPSYAGITTNTDGTVTLNTGLGYITDLATNPGQYAVLDGDYYYTAAFVDENIYTHTSMPQGQWAGFTVDDRVMIFNPDKRLVSPNGQSVLGPNTGFYISQKPIQSSYDLSDVPTGNNPFGFEQVEEPTACPTYINPPNNKYFSHALQWGSNQPEDYDLSTDINGQASTAHYFQNISPMNDVFYKTNDKGEYVLNNSSVTTVSQALAVRNRDLDGDGKINGNEIHWYVPTLTQYQILWFSRKNIPDRYKLFDYNILNDTKTEVSGGKSFRDAGFPKYFTSSPRAARRVYWIDQGGAFSHQNQLTENSSWFQIYHNVRFVRNLGLKAHQPEGVSEVTREISRLTESYNEVPNVIHIRNTYAARQNSWTGPYPLHTFFNDHNEAPQYMEYMDKPLKIDWSFYNGSTAQQKLDNLNALALKAYNDDRGTAHTSLPDGWRVPNQRELTILFVNNILNNTALTSGGTARTVTCCTIPYGKAYEGLSVPSRYMYSNNFWVCQLTNDYYGEIYVWLVRDHNTSRVEE